MTTNDVRDFMAMLGIVPKGNCYSYRLDNKKEKSIGAYPLKRSGAAHIPIGGMDNTSYGVFPASFLIHWTEQSKESEEAAKEIYNTLLQAGDVQVNDYHVKFLQMLVPEAQYVGMDDFEVHEWVIEALLFYERQV